MPTRWPLGYSQTQASDRLIKAIQTPRCCFRSETLGARERPNAGRWLIVNADDFGQSQGLNQGIARAHEQGIVTSASLMVRWPAAAAAARYARRHPGLSLGLHVDLGEWICRQGAWRPLYEVVPSDDPKAVHSEIERQIAQFRQLVGAVPTHVDSHQHAHREEPARSVFMEAARALGVPLRGSSGIHYRGDFYGQTADGKPIPRRLSAAGLIRILKSLPLGISELGCHPGDPAGLETMYLDERLQEIEVLCDPLVRAALQAGGITLCSFRDRCVTERTRRPQLGASGGSAR